MKTILLLLFISLTYSEKLWSQSEDDVPVAPSTRDAAFLAVEANAGQLITSLYANQPEFTADEFRKTLYALTEDLYAAGYINLSQLMSKKGQVDDCVIAHQEVLNTSGLAKVAAQEVRQQKCTLAVNYTDLKAAVPPCIQANQLQSGAQCCTGLIQSVSYSLEANLAGKKTDESCAGHTDCASKVCNKDEGATAGTCGPVMTCLPLNPEGGECSMENPNCAGGVCQSVEAGAEGLTCKKTSETCSVNEDCCSTRCSSGKCVDKYICQKCVPEGVSPGKNEVCCRGFIKDLDNKCILELPPFILPSDASFRRKPSLWKALANILWNSTAHAQELETPTSPDSTPNTSQGTWVNDDALTEAQLDYIETEIKKILDIKEREPRKKALLKIYAERKEMAGKNAAAVKAGQKVGKLYTQEEYIKRYNIPAIKPKERSNVERCEFDTAKDNWLDSSNLLRNAELFMRAFEVSYSGKATQDYWHLLDKSEKPNKQNLYTRTKGIMSEWRDNRHHQGDQLKYLDLLMACQCLYAFGPENFDEEKQAFFYSQCGQERPNKICRDGEMRESLKLPSSAESAYRDGKEFPNYVEMYFQKLTKMQNQGSQRVDAQGRPIKDDVDNLDSGAAGINHEELLVRWLRMRSCNQIDVFVDTEKIETELHTIAEDLNRAKKPVARLTTYWNQRLEQMSKGGVNKKIVDIFRNDPKKDTWFRGYVHTESKVFSWKKKIFKFLLFLFLALLVVGLGLAGLISLSTAGMIGGGILGAGMMLSGGGGGPTSVAHVLDTFAKDFPSVIIEDRLVEKKSCGFLKLFWCKTYYRILHWPAYSNNPGIEASFPWKKKEERTCDETHKLAISYPGVQPNPCSGPFKGTMCARSFFRPIPDGKIVNAADFQPWKEFMKDRTLMDPVTPDFFEEPMNLDNKWVPSLQDGFLKGCQWAKSIGKRKPKPEDKTKFFPDFTKYMDTQGVFKPEFVFDQKRIDAYKGAVKKYALCWDIKQCGAKNYDGTHEYPLGFADIFCPNQVAGQCSPESVKNAELFSEYVYQMHFNWRHMSGDTGIGYPLAFLENYYLALLHNVRLLTTLSIRRGIELDDAFNRYAADLAVRRNRYQMNSGDYDMGMGDSSKVEISESGVFRSFRTLGFPLSAEFVGLPGSTSLPGTAQSSETASGKTLNSFEMQALKAASRVATRVAKDNMAWKNFQERTKGNKESSRRLELARRRLGTLNSPLSAVRGMARPGDNSFYSGIGGKADLGDKKEGGSENETKQKYGAGASASGNYISGDSASGAGFGAESSPAYSPNYSTSGGEGATVGSQDNALDEAARLTGMKSGEVQTMLDSANQGREKGLLGSENDSLFEKVSKAYMRNLDRVLLRSQPSPKQEVGPKREGDPEKEELKKILSQ